MWELPCMVLASAVLGSALPCCPDPNEISLVNDSLVCLQNINIDHPKVLIHKWCDNFFLIDKEQSNQNGSVFYENENKTEFNNGEVWSPEYCTGILRADPTEEDKELSFSGMLGKEFAVICFHNVNAKYEDHFLLYGVCFLISCVFLLATLIVYIILPDLRDTQGRCVFCLVLSLLLGYLGLSYLQLPFTAPLPIHPSCVYAAFYTYFWMLSAFFWLNISSFNMWRNSVLAHVEVAEKKLMVAYYAVGFGGPFLFLLFALVTHHLPGEHIKPSFGKESCWFQSKFEQWTYFYGIVLVLLLLNIVYFVSTALYLYSEYQRPNPRPRIRAMRTKFCVYFRLFMIMGITWIFEIISAIANEPWLVTDVINCLQGIVIFLVMVVFRKRVWRGLAALKFCGESRRLPRCWEQMEDEESENEPIENTQIST